ncbi:MAG: DNA-3-methyladenine glycosylase [Egibacteraceae bacterium]
MSGPQDAAARPPDAVALGAAFFARPAPEVAAALCGVLLARPDEGLLARIVEAEAYTEDDPSCHAHRRRTAANEPLFGAPGTAYVYRSYGVHWLFNVATGAEDVGQGVLVRAAEPLAGLEAMRARRGGRPDRDLLRGPGRLAQGFGLDGSWSGVALSASALDLYDDGARPAVTAGPRVGIAEAADWPWRFAVAGSPWVSRYVRSPRAPAPPG